MTASSITQSPDLSRYAPFARVVGREYARYCVRAWCSLLARKRAGGVEFAGVADMLRSWIGQALASGVCDG